MYVSKYIQFKVLYLVSVLSLYSRLLQMGCYGIGVTRLLAASIEALSLDDEIRWPEKIAPYLLYIIPQKVNCFL